MITKSDESSSEYSSESSVFDSQIWNSVDSMFTANMPQDELRRRVSRIRTDHSTGEDIVYPELTSVEGLVKWACKLEIALQTSGIPPHQWSDAAIVFLAGSGRVNMAMRSRRESRRNKGIVCWPWEEFKNDLQEVLVAIQNEPSTIQRLQRDHPMAITAAKVTVGTGLVIAGTTVLAPAVVVGTLNGLGFTASGVAGGSIAAGAQSVFYGGATTGLFSLCQSLGTVAVASSGSIATAAGTIAAGVSMLRPGKAEDTKPEIPTSDAVDSNSSQATPPPYHL